MWWWVLSLRVLYIAIRFVFSLLRRLYTLFYTIIRNKYYDSSEYNI